jgi:NAD(P)-dependent dehydrogenase (short-subunit alcohol dehydrogenase family)
VTVSSGAHVIGTLHFDDLHAEKRYDRWRRYGMSKLANLLFTSELQRRAGGRILSVAAHPGYAATHLQEGQGQALFEALMRVGNRVLAQSDIQGAWPSLYAATMPDVAGDSYYGPHLMGLRGHPVATWRTAAAKSTEDARKLWDVSEELTKVVYAF